MWRFFGLVIWIVASVAGSVMYWSHPDQTGRRIFLDHPAYIIGWGIIGLIGISIVCRMPTEEERRKERRRWRAAQRDRLVRIEEKRDAARRGADEWWKAG